MSQNYENHRKFDAPYHFALAPATMVVAVVAIWNAFQQSDLTSLLLAAVCLCLVLNNILLRINLLKVQDRVIRAEVAARYHRLTGESFDPIAARLRKGQIVALRFASDTELPGLVKAAVEENLGGDAIKRRIKEWRADEWRV